MTTLTLAELMLDASSYQSWIQHCAVNAFMGRVWLYLNSVLIIIVFLASPLALFPDTHIHLFVLPNL